jgi:hypothetical protein
MPLDDLIKSSQVSKKDDARGSIGWQKPVQVIVEGPKALGEDPLLKLFRDFQGE